MFYKKPPPPPYLICGVPKYRGQSVKWVPSDTEEHYNNNLADPHFKELLLINNWIGNEFTYDFNLFGFRSPELISADDGKESVLFLGCSHTFGIGLPLENTYPYIVSKDLNINYWNLAVPGSSLDTAFRLASYWIDVLKPTYVVLGKTEETRVEMHSPNDDNCWHWNVTNKKNVPIDSIEDADKDAIIRWYQNYYIHSKNQYKFNVLKNIAGIKHYAQSAGSRFIELGVIDLLQSIWHKTDLARDCAHAGVKANIKLADVVKYLILEQK